MDVANVLPFSILSTAGITYTFICFSIKLSHTCSRSQYPKPFVRQPLHPTGVQFESPMPAPTRYDIRFTPCNIPQNRGHADSESFVNDIFEKKQILSKGGGRLSNQRARKLGHAKSRQEFGIGAEETIRDAESSCGKHRAEEQTNPARGKFYREFTMQDYKESFKDNKHYFLLFFDTHKS